MDLEHPPDHPLVSAQQAPGAKDGARRRPLQLPQLERFLKRIGFFDYKYNAM